MLLPSAKDSSLVDEVGVRGVVSTLSCTHDKSVLKILKINVELHSHTDERTYHLEKSRRLTGSPRSTELARSSYVQRKWIC